jgi:hypothetical protein
MRNKLTFIHRGRKSTYGLKKWEDERVDIKGGAIRDIVEEVLQKANSPKHISEIMKTVLSYRPETNEKNVLSNLRQESNNRFVFYESGFIGLKNNPSTAEFEGYRRTVGSHFRDSVFRKMIGWTKDEIVEYFVKKLNYKLQQIEYILDKKQLAGDITFNEKNELVYG